MAQATRTFRVFVSSTFNDLKEERNALQRDVFAQLRDLCRAHGARFQAIDLRWGVRDEAALDQRTMRICLDEIERCRRTSPRPNFVVLLGDRYGWRPLPAVIPAAEFERVCSHIGEPADAALVREWYVRDDNAVPPEYGLKPRTVPLTAEQTVAAQEAIRVLEAAEWSVTESSLRRILSGAARRASLGDEERQKYEASATEQEIHNGALKVSDAHEHVFCYFREIANISEPNAAAALYAEDDPDARLRLQALKDRLREQLPGNVHSYEARWAGSAITLDHIPRLCAEVLEDLTRVIRGEIQRLEDVDPLDREIASHDAFSRARARVFIGRASVLEQIGAYVTGAVPEPLAVFGDSGTGKSAVMAVAARQTRGAVPAAIVVERFIGATPGSSDIRTLLDGLCRQISRDYGADETTIPNDYRELVQELPKRLALATDARPLVVFFDALDQLSDADRARSATWLPPQLPDHVRLILSTVPGESLDALQRKLRPENLIQLQPMPVSEANQLLDLWLADAGRTLQPHQRREVLDAFAQSRSAAGSGLPPGEAGLPLYLKLAFEEARHWTSSTVPQPLSRSIPLIIRDLFRRLSEDANHGAMTVSRSLAYIAAAKNGLSEDELLDVLTMDDDVYDDFEKRARHMPPERRLPVIVWSRLFFDLEPYLTERAADGASLLGFYHRQLREVAEAEFLSGDDRRARHATLAAYFEGLKLFEREGVANLRKLSELPYQQTYAAAWDALYKTLTDFEFLEAKCTYVNVVSQGSGAAAQKIYGGVYELQEDYRRALDRFPTT